MSDRESVDPQTLLQAAHSQPEPPSSAAQLVCYNSSPCFCIPRELKPVSVFGKRHGVGAHIFRVGVLFVSLHKQNCMLKLKSNDNENRHPMEKKNKCSNLFSLTPPTITEAGSHQKMGLPANFIFTPAPGVF